MSRPKFSESTDTDWKFFRHMADADTNLLVSAWLWEYTREALAIQPECLDWHWAWREENAEDIKEAVKGSEAAIRRLAETDTGFRLSAWMISPDFPESSLCANTTWNRMKKLASALPPCGGVDEPNQGVVRRRFYNLEDDEVFSLMTEDEFLPGLGAVRRNGRLILPVEIDLTKSDDFLRQSFGLMIESIRKRYEEDHGSVPISSGRGKTTESALREPELKMLAAKRLFEFQKQEKFAWKVAARLAQKTGVDLYADTAEPSWHRARNRAVEIAQSWAKMLDGINGGKWLIPYLKGLDEMERKLNRD